MQCIRPILLMVVFLLVLFPGTSFSDDSKPILPKHSFGLSMEAGYFDYEEDGLMEETGWLYGLNGKYAFHGNNGLMVSTSLRYSFGELDYDGGTWGGTPVTADTKDWILEFRGLIGSDMVFGGRHIVTPYVGIGHRYWNDEIEGSGGYEREIRYLYLPIGVKTLHPISSSWNWGVNAEFDYFLGGEVKSHLSDADPLFSNPTNDQDAGDGFGARFSFLFECTFNERMALSIEPYIRYWDIEESERVPLIYNGGYTGYVVFEPENETMFYGVSLNFRF